jgi:hypothetical protein
MLTEVPGLQRFDILDGIDEGVRFGTIGLAILICPATASRSPIGTNPFLLPYLAEKLLKCHSVLELVF